jgi:D-ribose pyranase
LLKKQGVLNHRIVDVIAQMGHTDRLVLADAGLPVPLGVERIDVAIAPGLPKMLDVARAIASELKVEQLIVATELSEKNAEFLSNLRELFPGVPIAEVPHEEFKAMTKEARAVVRTGECTPYANVILCSGVIF